MMPSNVKDLATLVVRELGCTNSEAQKTVKLVLDSMLSEIERVGSFSYRGYFTIEKKIRKGKKGSVNGYEFDSPDKYVLKISTGNILDKRMNP